jgi:hypothetical protein
MATRRGIGRRGVVFTLDLSAALLFFLIILLAMFWLWEQSYRHMGDYRETAARHSRLLELSSMLVKTQGTPQDWQNREVTPENVRTMGLASEDNVLDPAKLDAMEAADYQHLREIMGFGSEDFELSVSGNYSGQPQIYFDKGNSTASGERMIVRRYAIYNGTLVELKLQAYYNKTK